MRIKLTICYDGTNYKGWQIQKNVNTIQNEIQKALKTIFKQDITIFGSSRTDAGVHAFCQIAHFDITTLNNISINKLHIVINQHLNKDIQILKSEIVDDTFDARKSTLLKTYQYTCYLSNEIIPIFDRYATRISPNVNITQIKKCMSLFIGYHNFNCYAKKDKKIQNTYRTITEFNLNIVDNKLIFTITGNGFLYNMVRNIIGAVLYQNNNLPKIQETLITGTKINIKKMEAKGLCLVNIKYF